MAIAKMCRAEFVTARSDKLSLINYLQETGVTSIVEDKDLSEALSERNILSSFDALDFKVHDYKVFSDLMSTQRRPNDAVHLLQYSVSMNTLDKLITEALRWQERLEQGMKVLAPYDDEKKPLFKQRREIPLAERYMDYPEEVQIHEWLIDIEDKLDAIAAGEQRLAGMKTHLRSLEPWKDLELPRTRNNDYINTAIGYFDKQEDYKDLLKEAKAERLALATDIYFTADDGSLAVLLAWPKIDEEPVRRLLAGSALRKFPATTDVERKGHLARAYAQQQQRIEYSEKRLNEDRESIKAHAGHIRDFELLYDVLEADIDKMRTLRKISNSSMLSAFSGYVPAAIVPQLSKELSERFVVVMAFSEPEPDDEQVPTLLVNNEAVQPVESVINTFSPPNYFLDSDPTFVMMFTYAIFFGSMLSDIGYGLLLLIGCLIGVYKLKAEGNLRQMLLVFASGGAAAVIFGVLYGSFFGNLLPTLSDGRAGFKPLWFDPMENPINLMIWSIVFGAVHLFIGMAFDIKNKIRDGNWHDALFAVAPWYLIIGGLGLLALRLPFAKYVVIAGVAIVLFLSPRGKNPFKRLGSGLGNLYDVTSWLSDLLSYTRILALTLATSVIAMVVNMMASMVGTKGPAVIALVIILLIGHVMNLALSTLSAYVHATRLHYVEFFGRFYTGGGILFTPLRIRGQYTKIGDVKPLSVRSEKQKQDS